MSHHFVIIPYLFHFILSMAVWSLGPICLLLAMKFREKILDSINYYKEFSEERYCLILRFKYSFSSTGPREEAGGSMLKNLREYQSMLAFLYLEEGTSLYFT